MTEAQTKAPPIQTLRNGCDFLQKKPNEKVKVKENYLYWKYKEKKSDQEEGLRLKKEEKGNKGNRGMDLVTSKLNSNSENEVHIKKG